jgi:hypothetical protein
MQPVIPIIKNTLPPVKEEPKALFVTRDKDY